MTTPRTIECALPTGRGQSRRPARQARVAGTPGRVPRVSRLLALALRLDRLVRAGEIADYATLARLGHVSRARVGLDLFIGALLLGLGLSRRFPRAEYASPTVTSIPPWLGR
jgi:hypothetical protein